MKNNQGGKTKTIWEQLPTICVSLSDLHHAQTTLFLGGHRDSLIALIKFSSRLCHTFGVTINGKEIDRFHSLE